MMLGSEETVFPNASTQQPVDGSKQLVQWQLM